MNAPRTGFRTLGAGAAVVAFAAVFAAAGGARSAVAPSNTALPVVSGTAQVGSVLDASTGSWNGSPTITFASQWQRCDNAGANCVAIAGATSSTYAVIIDDLGHRLRVHVTATNSSGSATADSNPTALVTGSDAPTNSASPAISGNAAQGYTLTATTGTWTGSGNTYAYQWRRCDSTGAACADISGGTSQTYLLTSSDAGHTIRVLVTATNGAGAGAVLSPATATIVVPAPGNTTAPAVTGTATEGQTLTVANGEWIGGQPITYTYQWQRCDSSGNNCSAISGAAQSTYKLVTADVGHDVRATVTASNSIGKTPASSNAVGPVTASGPTVPTGGVKLPDGKTSIPASSVPDTDRLNISSVKVSPSVSRRHSAVGITFTITNTVGYVVNGALVYVVAAPSSWAAKMTEQATGAEGTVTITVTPSAKAPKTGSIILFVRARTPTGSKLAGSSARRLIQVKLRP